MHSATNALYVQWGAKKETCDLSLWAVQSQWVRQEMISIHT